MSPRFVNRDHDTDIRSSWMTSEVNGWTGPYLNTAKWGASIPRSVVHRVHHTDQLRSVGHGRYWARNRGPLNDVGSDFTMRRTNMSSSGFPVGWRWKTRTIRHWVNQMPYFQPALLSRDTLWADWDDTVFLGPYGAEAIAAVRPGKPETDMLLSLVELVREGLPKAIGQQTLKDPSLKGSSGDWLNYQFGIVPLMNDFKSLVKTAQDQDKLIQKINASSGKPTRRRYEFEPKLESESIDIKARDLLPAWFEDILYSPRASGQIVGGRYDSTERRIWFSGSFTSYVALPRSDRAWAERTAGIARHLYGVRVSPELIWNLTPWTWAADWVTNAGDVVSNASAFLSGDVVMHRGYIMAETKVTRRWRMSTPGYGMDWNEWRNTGWDPLKGSQLWEYHSKVRRRANPYTVGFTGESLDPRQVSILVALGISRG